MIHTIIFIIKKIVNLPPESWLGELPPVITDLYTELVYYFQRVFVVGFSLR